MKGEVRESEPDDIECQEEIRKGDGEKKMG